MKLQVSNTNQPQWNYITISNTLPDALKPLEEMSKNLWWVWFREGKSLFRDLDKDLWRETGENPVMVLQRLSSERYEEIMKDKAMMARIKEVYKLFKSYMKQPMRHDLPSVA